ncbi:MAG: hypothetical protein OEY52_15330 [Gammaproteobacteria bacterium]|nr:hypothetical protein [Gammaproteobacteria bacterium]
MTAHVYRILIGASNWLHPAWQEDFYPEDLPEDWQLGFYSNEFPVALIPGDLWPKIENDIAEWLEDCTDELKLICEIPKQLISQSIEDSIDVINNYISSLSVLDGYLLAVVLPVTEINEELSTIIEQIHCPVPLCLDVADSLSSSHDKTAQKICAQTHVSLVWHGNDEPIGFELGKMAMTRIDGSKLDMRQLRDVVETILNKTSLEQTCVMIVEGEPPDLATIRNANVILDLF